MGRLKREPIIKYGFRFWVCRYCKNELPEANFHLVNGRAYSYCRDCYKHIRNNGGVKKNQPPPLSPEDSEPPEKMPEATEKWVETLKRLRLHAEKKDMPLSACLDAAVTMYLESVSA